MNNTALDAYKTGIVDLLDAASTTQNPRRAKRILRRLGRLRQVGNEQEVYIIMMGIVLAETWPALHDWFWICTQSEWTMMTPEVLEMRPFVRPPAATDQSQEFLRGVAGVLRLESGNNIEDLRLLRTTIARHSRTLDI
jgi:hypothetical protein